MAEDTSWQDALYDLLQANNVTQFAYVPNWGAGYGATPINTKGTAGTPRPSRIKL